MKNKISKLISFLLVSLMSPTTSFAHPDHGNNNLFHSHYGFENIFIVFIIGVFISVTAYYIYKKTLSK